MTWVLFYIVYSVLECCVESQSRSTKSTAFPNTKHKLFSALSWLRRGRGKIWSWSGQKQGVPTYFPVSRKSGSNYEKIGKIPISVGQTPLPLRAIFNNFIAENFFIFFFKLLGVSCAFQFSTHTTKTTCFQHTNPMFILDWLRCYLFIFLIFA